MKKNIILIAAVLLAGCNDWLDVRPKAEIKGKYLFTSPDGFEDALTGVYIGLTSNEIYGANLSWGAIEFLACQYSSNNLTGQYAALQRGDHENARARLVINAIWSKMYNVIAEINYLLQMLDEQQGVFPATDPLHRFETIKGEALALRAFCHFDLIRLFAKGNLANNPAALDDKCIPYVKAHSKHVTPQASYRETLALLREDIAAARELLRPGATGKLYYNHFTRFNYLSLLQLEARVSQWEGNEARTLEITGELLPIIEEDIEAKYLLWATESPGVVDGSGRDTLYAQELLFYLDATKLPQYMETAYTLYVNSSENVDILAQPEAFVHELYNIATDEGRSDLRFMRWYSKMIDTRYLTVKLRKSTVVPLMRLSEVYLMAAECHVSGGEPEKAIEYLNLIKVKRNIATQHHLPDNTPAEELPALILQEYRREYPQEGQLFFLYKRLGLTSIPNQQYPGEMTDKQYTLPYPVVEQDFGRE
jgi:hypothetical protein